MGIEEIKQEILRLTSLYFQEKTASSQVRTYIPASGKSIGEDELANMIEASLDMWLTTGRFNDTFEKDFADKLGIKYALTVNSGSSANLLAISALTSYKLGNRAIKKGDEIITVAAGFPTTVAPIVQNGLIPVFIDCELDTYNAHLSAIEKAISPKTKAVFFAHTLGNMCDIDELSELCQKHGLWLIEDSCDALGATYKSKQAGTTGHIGTFSFYPAHHITMGEGGAIVTTDKELYTILLSMRDWGRDCWCKPGMDNTCKNRFNFQLGKLPFGYDHKYTYSHLGYNLKITDWQAAIGAAQLKKLDSFVEQRRKNATYLLKKLSKYENYFLLPKVLEENKPSWFGFLLSVKEDAPFTKQEIVEYLEKNNIGTRQLFAGNMLRQPMFSEVNIAIRINDSKILYSNELTEEEFSLLPNTEFIMNNTFWIGCFQGLTEKDLEKTVSVFDSFFEQIKA